MTDKDDDEFWQETVRGIKPLPEKNGVPTVKKTFLKKTQKEDIVPLKLFKHELGLGTHADIDRNTMRRFKRGEFPVEGVLDLHGYTEDKAYDAVRRFVTESYLAGKRCVMIITGKGLYHRDEDVFQPKGVLRERVPQWLNQDNLKQLILTYIHPSAKMGGEGALCLLLRRSRS